MNAGALNFTLGLQASQFLNSLNVSSGALVGFSAVATGVRAALDKMWGAVQKGGSLNDLAASANVSVKTLYQLQQAFEEVGASAGSVPAVVNKLRRTLGGGEQNDLLSSMGLDPTKLAGMDIGAQFEAVAGALAKMNVNARSNAAGKIFGREGATVVMQIANSGKDFAEAMQAAAADGEIWQKVSKSFDNMGDSVKRMFAHMDAQVAKFTGGFVQAFKEGHLAETIFETFSLSFQAIGAALPHLLAAGLVGIGQALLDVFRVPVAFLQTEIDASVQRWMTILAQIPGVRDALGIPKDFKPDSWSDIYTRNKERGYEFFPGMSQGSGEFVKQQMQAAAAAAQPFLNQIGVTFQGLLNRMDQGTPGPLVGEDKGSIGKSGAPKFESTAIEKMGGVLFGLGRGLGGDDGRQTASNTKRLVAIGEQTVKLLGNNSSASFANI